MTSLKSLFDMKDRVALVTGGSRGLGFQIAEALGEFGARVVLVARKASELAEAVTRLQDQGIDAAGIDADLSDRTAISGLVTGVVASHGSIDVLVNNAGASWGAPAEDYPPEAWAKVFALNVDALFFLTREVAGRCFLPRGKGSIVNIASIEGMRGHHSWMVGTVAYNTSKGAVINMTRALAGEWGGRGVRVNALAPGFFPTKLTRGTLDRIGEMLADETPLGRLGGEDDLKGAALLLASDAGSYITGHVLVVDGGTTAI